MAFIGFRHGHILGLYRLAEERADIEIAAVCEEDAATRARLAQDGVRVTHAAYAAMLADVECDVVACGDFFGIRGARLIQALERGRHVIGDKPLCTSLDELDCIQALSRASDLRVGCMLDMRALGPFLTLRQILRQDRIGEVQTILFWGQHPLMYGERPMWYFEPGKHGGTINDIAVHAVDIIPWLTGRRIVEITAARAWNARLPEHPEFQDGAVLMLRLDNGGAVMGDVSYFASDRLGYQMPQYWRFTISGTDGVAETACTESTVRVWRHDSDTAIEEAAAGPQRGAYLDDFLKDLAGAPNPNGLDTARVLESSRITLLAQQAADSGEFPVPVRLG